MKILRRTVADLETGRMGEPIKALQKWPTVSPDAAHQRRRSCLHHNNADNGNGNCGCETEDIIYRAGGTVKQISDNFRVSGHANRMICS